MVAEPTVRRADPADGHSIAEIYTESILARDSTMDTEPFETRDAERLITSLGPREAVFVLETTLGVQGWGIVKKYSDRSGYAIACETSIYLFRDRLRRGWGRQLQSTLLGFAREAGYHHVVARIWADNKASIAFHECCGFTMVGVQREIGLVDGLRRNVAIMQCILID